MTDADAFYAAIDADPDNPLSRLVYADWLDERAGTEPCPECEGTGYGVCVCGLPYCDHRYPGPAEHGHVSTVSCDICDGTGHVPDGRARLAAGYRAMAELKVFAHRSTFTKHYYWSRGWLPLRWFDTLRWMSKRGRRKIYLSRRAAEDAAALAWAAMADAERDQCRRELALAGR